MTTFFKQPKVSKGLLKRRRKARHKADALPAKYQERVAPEGGIERKVMQDGHVRERCLTPEAMQERREELYARSGSHCEGCMVVTIYLDSYHLHHFRGRGRGRCDCMACIQALCPDAALTDSTIRYGCHTLAHQAIDIQGKFDPEKKVRLGNKFVRPETAYSSRVEV